MTTQDTPSGTTAAPQDALLRIKGLSKSFAANRALDDVSLDLRGGEIVAVVGHNGSGKSTLVKILASVYTADAGTVDLGHGDGEEPTEIHIIHQDLGLAAELSAVENLGIPKYQGRSAWVPFSPRRERAAARQLIGRFGSSFDVTAPVGRLAPAQRAVIAIARALDGWKHPRNILVLDEPTEALHASEVAVLFDAVRKLAAEGAGVIFISHRLDEVLDLADRIVVLRDGRKVADEPRAEIDHDRLVEYVTGVAAGEAESGRARRAVGKPVLSVENLSGADIEGLDLTIHAGEVVGVAGVLGSGREALPAIVFGSIPSTADRFELDGEPYERRSPSESIERGIGYVPGDRARLGSVRPLTARENVTLPDLNSLKGGLGMINPRRERSEVAGLIATYDVRPPRQEQVFAQFSGGNQQKLVFAKWLRNEPALLLLEEPTQGVDIGAKKSLYDAIDTAAADGAGVLVCSSEAKELVRLCDRVLVLRDGRVAAELSGEDLTETRLVKEGYGLADEGAV